MNLIQAQKKRNEIASQNQQLMEINAPNNNFNIFIFDHFISMQKKKQTKEIYDNIFFLDQ